MAKNYSIHINPTVIMERYQRSARELGKAINSFVYNRALEIHVPEDRGTLAKSLREKVTISPDGKIICSFSSSVHYAQKQHDFKLRHTSSPKGHSFALYGITSLGERSNARDRHKALYQSGYRALVKLGKTTTYASKFFTHPLDYVKVHLDQFADTFFRSFNNKG